MVQTHAAALDFLEHRWKCLCGLGGEPVTAGVAGRSRWNVEKYAGGAQGRGDFRAFSQTLPSSSDKSCRLASILFQRRTNDWRCGTQLERHRILTFIRRQWRGNLLETGKFGL